MFIISQNQAYSCLWKIFLFIINQNKAYSCLWTKTKHNSCLWARNDKSLLLIYKALLYFNLLYYDYCNSVLYGLPAIALAPLQRVLHAVVRLVAILGYRDHVPTAMRELHWLPIAYRIKYKLCLMIHATVNNRSPAYITDILVPTSSLLHRERLRSHESGGFEVPRVRTEFGRRAFSIAGPTV